MAEVWKPVVGREGDYEVSDLGRVRSLDGYILRRCGKGANPDGLMKQFRKGRILRPGRHPFGYLMVNLERRMVPIQWMVAEAFIGPRPVGMMVLHNDGVPHNNAATNLRYGTDSENVADAFLHGTKPFGSRCSWAKLHEWTAGCIRALKGFAKPRELALLFDISEASVRLIHAGKSWCRAPVVSREAAEEWFWSYGPGGALAPINDNNTNELDAQRELDRRHAK